MKCDNEFCIYETNGHCVLEEIELDITGQCKDCIYVTINEKILNSAKENTFKDMEK